MTFSRRAFFSASAGLTLAPFTSASWLGASARAATLPRDVDVVVIGAGAAGVAAARRIQAAGRRVIVLEASAQIGGRCATDSSTFDVPLDLGARWLHTPETNALVKLARGAGIEVSPSPPSQKLRIGRRNARAAETEDLLATFVRATRAIDEAARRGDNSCAAALPKDLGDWNATVDFALGAYATGKDLKDLSALDQSRAEDRAISVATRQGLGVVMAKLGESVPVALSTPATRITWSGRDIGVETASGRIAARAVIVTVSSNVLNAGAIKFTPELPKRQLDAAAKLTLGSYDRIALELKGNPLGLGRDELMIEQSTSARTGALFANIGGSSLCTVDVAGSFGRGLAAQGEAAMVDFAAEWLTKLFGSDVKNAVQRSKVTRWDTSPFILGAMSAASPGGQFARRVLAEPLGNLFIAGEATHETLWGTVDGAWQTGERAASAALKKIGAVKEPDAEPKPAKKQKRRAPQSSNASGE
ncbi:FAD-dependent oxidoreductase [Rhodopseudomonas boonkerdii]|uniref:flavin monoamine oxidase family protein n=1 Tax=Rhodopseudomonas boonkerdii TaxID=475937 RepID=UPI001E4AD58E|nr:NAD(P)/FAD-dependent oxidoreductase [Rhodopseudomonas boonkerdii]UGV24475.1 FAD-dependent oxidoreductase [Rhodopseudomonas boonkerdii]